MILLDFNEYFLNIFVNQCHQTSITIILKYFLFRIQNIEESDKRKMVVNEDQMENPGKDTAKTDETCCYLSINGNYEKTFQKYTLSYESIITTNIIVIKHLLFQSFLLLHSIFPRFDG